MKSTAETYRNAAMEHLARAEALHAGRQYYLSHYFSGLAVECMLRAHLRRQEKFDADHNLAELAEKANFYDFVSSSSRESYGAKFYEMNRRWRSNHRYFNEQNVRSYLYQIGADAGAKGDPFKNHGRTLLNLALEIVRLGERQWLMLR